MLAKVAEHYGLGSIVAIDPHNSPELLDHQADPAASSYKDFLKNIETAGIASQVEPHRAYSKDVSAGWNQPIRFLWIDGDHTYQGAKTDFDGFFPHVSPNGVMAIHDTLNVFSGPFAFLWKTSCAPTSLARRVSVIPSRGPNSARKTAANSRNNAPPWNVSPRR